MKNGLILLLCIAFSVSLVCAACPDGMVSYWKFDNSSNLGKDYADSHHGTKSGDAAFSSDGKIGAGSLDLTNTDTYKKTWLSVPRTSELKFGQDYSDFTIEAWVKPSAESLSSFKGIVGSWSNFGVSGGGIALAIENGNVLFWTGYAGTSRVIVSNSKINQTNTWYYVVLTKSGNNYKIYINGNLDKNKTDSQSIDYAASQDNLSIGSDGTIAPLADRFIGKIDEVAIYSQALTQQEVSSHWNNGKGKDYCHAETCAGNPVPAGCQVFGDDLVCQFNGTQADATSVARYWYGDANVGAGLYSGCTLLVGCGCSKCICGAFYNSLYKVKDSGFFLFSPSRTLFEVYQTGGSAFIQKVCEINQSWSMSPLPTDYSMTVNTSTCNSTSSGVAIGSWASLDITPIYKNWKNSGINNGLKLDWGPGQSCGAVPEFASPAYTDATKRPKVTLEGACSLKPTCAGNPVPAGCVVSGNDLVCELRENLLKDATVTYHGAYPKELLDIYRSYNGEWAYGVFRINKTNLPQTANKVIFSLSFNYSSMMNGALSSGDSYMPNNPNKTILSVYKVNSAWDYNSNWVSAPSMDAQIINTTIDFHQACNYFPQCSLLSSGGSCEYINFIITDLYNSWNSGNNFGFAIRDLYGDNAGPDCRYAEGGNRFSSSESGTKPKITFESACGCTPETRTCQQLGCGVHPNGTCAGEINCGNCKYSNITGAYWSDMLDEKMNETGIKDTVKMNVAGEEISGDITYTIYKKCTTSGCNLWSSFFGDEKVATLSSMYGFTKWIAGKKSDGSFETGEYYFKAKLTDETSYDSKDNLYGILKVTEPEENDMPVARIIEPEAEKKFITGALLNFTQANYDRDDDLMAIWNFGDDEIKKLIGCQTGTNCNTTHVYDAGGTKLIRLTAKEMTREQKNSTFRRIFAYEPGINIFVIVTSPDPLKEDIFPSGIVDFDASQSFVANCTPDICPTIPSYAKTTECYDVSNLKCYDLDNSKMAGNYNLWFNWTFDEGKEVYGDWLNNYDKAVEFSRPFVQPKEHWARLKVGYEKY